MKAPSARTKAICDFGDLNQVYFIPGINKGGTEVSESRNQSTLCPPPCRLREVPSLVPSTFEEVSKISELWPPLPLKQIKHGVAISRYDITIVVDGPYTTILVRLYTHMHTHTYYIICIDV